MRKVIPVVLAIAFAGVASPASAVFLSTDPVRPDTNNGTNFNRYWYANNNPYRFTDPDGRFSRGDGWTDRQWRQFDRSQQSAANSLERAANRLTSAMDAGGRQLQRAERSFERSFGAGSATQENMTKMAANMGTMAAALRDTRPGAVPAHGMTGTQIDGQYGGGSTTLAGVPTTGPTMVIVNTTHASFGHTGRLAWAAGHESSHTALGFKDQVFNGDRAYKFGTPQQQDVFRTLPGSQRIISPDHIMDHAR
ncbi:hypothetical protein LDO31_14670 [Luteimonas sp. XNQY3]|nr:hypothetical protein [Luteimonas sp. XNQY3]MCD9007460.1 hypothetical protein [Luteimonas sp. XNQY3]